MGDLNYRINLPYEKTHELISKKQWDKLAEMDQVNSLSSFLFFLIVISILNFYLVSVEQPVYFLFFLFRTELLYHLVVRQLKHELKKGRAFDGWTEGVISFPPTYKYEFNSEKYVGEDPKSGRRTPAW